MYVKQVSPDAMGAAAAHLEREYVYGCRLGVEESLLGGGAIFLCSAPDGGEFRLYADKWGNVDRLPDDWADSTGEGQVATLRMLREDREARMSAKHEEWMAERR